MKNKPTTIKDIAEKLGISPSTVSRALKDHPDISKKTKEMVQKIAKEMKYHPNPIALNLRNRKNNTIGVIVPQVVHYFFSSIISGIEDYAHEKGYTILLTQSNESYEREVRNTELLLNSGVAGVLISRTKQTTDFSHFEKLLNFNIPIVFFDRICPSIKTDKVIINDEYASFIATEHLIKTGCKKIVHLRGPKNLEISTKRQTGYLEALHEYKIPINRNLIIKSDNFNEAKKNINTLLNNGVNFDGVFAVNDNAAAGAIVALKEHKIKIPQQVSVFGYSNDLISEIITPKLSTVEQHGYEMGTQALKLLIERLETEKELRPRTEVVSTNLILRESTKKIEE
jgi:LacI family transcriptional regulator